MTTFLTDKTSSYVVYSSSSEYYQFEDPDLLALFMYNKSPEKWRAYERKGGSWEQIAIEEGMTTQQLRKAILET